MMLRQETVIADRPWCKLRRDKKVYGEVERRTKEPWVDACAAIADLLQSDVHTKDGLEEARLDCIGSHDTLAVAEHGIAKRGKSG